MSEKKKMSNAKLFALVISVLLHGALIYYLGSMALDYALPKGEVVSYEMDFNKGNQTETTQVDVVETKPVVAPAPTPAKPTPPRAKPVAQPKSLPQALPTKEAPVEDQQGALPVATEIPEDTHKEMMEESKEEVAAPVAEPAPEVAQEAPPEVVPTPAAPVAASPEATNQPFGTPEGVQSDTVLVPYGSNRPISYPTMARFRKLEGVAVIHYTVSGSGQVTEVNIMQSSGHAVLDNQAVDTIKNWKFKPTGKDGVYERPVRFQLAGDSKEAPSQLRRLKSN